MKSCDVMGFIRKAATFFLNSRVVSYDLIR